MWLIFLGIKCTIHLIDIYLLYSLTVFIYLATYAHSWWLSRCILLFLIFFIFNSDLNRSGLCHFSYNRTSLPYLAILTCLVKVFYDFFSPLFFVHSLGVKSSFLLLLKTYKHSLTLFFLVFITKSLHGRVLY